MRVHSLSNSKKQIREVKPDNKLQLQEISQAITWVCKSEAKTKYKLNTLEKECTKHPVFTMSL